MNTTLLILSVLDFLLTALLLDRCGSMMEANPLAAAIYDLGGACGLLLLKSSMVGVTLGVIHLVRAARRPRTAFALSFFACLAAAIAVINGGICHAYLC